MMDWDVVYNRDYVMQYFVNKIKIMETLAA